MITTPLRNFSFGFIAAISVVFAGCAVKPNEGDSLPTLTVPEREAQLRAFKPWRAQGSIAIDSKADGKFNASFAWDVTGLGFDIKLFGPLGVQAIHLSQDQSGAQLTDRSGTIDGESAEQLLLLALGSEVPINQMQAWAVGLPGNATQIVRDEAGKLSSMIASDGDAKDWKIDFNRYTVYEEMQLPKTIVVVGDGVTINLQFKKWSRAESRDSNRLSIPGVKS